MYHAAKLLPPDRVVLPINKLSHLVSLASMVWSLNGKPGSRDYLQSSMYLHACNVATRSAQVSSPVGVRQLIVLHGCCKVAHAFMAASQAEMCDLQIDAIMLVSYPECFVPFTTRLQYHYSAAAVLRSVKWTQIFLYKGHTRGMLFLMHQVPSDQGLPQG